MYNATYGKQFVFLFSLRVEKIVFVVVSLNIRRCVFIILVFIADICLNGYLEQ